jgi:hypothetical protein
MTPIADRLSVRLTRHFFSSLFDLGFLSDAGVQSFTRLILGFCAVFLALGLLLVRIFMEKYGSMDGESSEQYVAAVIADHTFLIAVPMWIVAFVAILIGHAVFPDETDFRVLMALPITRRLVFGAKLAALALFAAVFIAAAQVALAPLFVLTAMRSFAEGTFALSAVAHATATLLGSAFSILAVIAAQGVMLIGAPRGQLVAFAAGLRSAMLCGLVISLPLLIRLPGQSRALREGAFWVNLAPPAWFMGLERFLLGDRSAHMIQMATLAIVAFAVATGVAATSYALLYQRFDRVMARPSGGVQSWRERGATWRGTWRTRRPVLSAIRAFTWLTLRRSVMHQGIIVALGAVGLGLAVNTFIRADYFQWLATGSPPSRDLVIAAIWATFPLIFVAVLAVRTALLVPVELKANWIFRIIEQDDRRVDQLKAGLRTAMTLGVVVPALLVAPVQWTVIRQDVFAVLASTILWGWLFVEILMRDWGRIPFTCSYIPGKGFLPQTILKGLGSFVAFTTLGTALARFATFGFPVVLYFEAVVLIGAVALAWRRLTIWQHTILAFEDDLPTDVNPLRLMD